MNNNQRLEKPDDLLPDETFQNTLSFTEPQNEFNRDYVLTCCKGLYDEAFEANACNKIMIQLFNHQKDGYHGMDCSPAFYGTVYKALYRACIMDLAKIYDADSASINFQKILSYCRRYSDRFPETLQLKYKCSDGTYDIEEKSITVTLSDEDIKDIKKPASLLLKVKDHADLFNQLHVEQEPPFKISVTTKEYFAVCQSRLNRRASQIEKLKNLRNKRFAHNDEALLFDIDSLMKDNSISLSEITDLADMALDFVVIVICLITGEQLAKEYYNIDDISNTFAYVRLGKQKESRKLNE